MRFFFHSLEGDAISLARAVQREGHEAIVYIRSEKHKHMGDGLVEKADSIEYADSFGANVIIFDHVHHGDLADSLRSSIPVFGASSFADKIELDRIYGLEVAARCGLRLPETAIFTKDASTRQRMLELDDIVACGEDFSDARQFIEEHGGSWVFKPCGNKGTATTYISDDPLDMIYMLDRFENMLGDGGSFVLQRKLSGGHEISSEIWFAGDHILEGSFNVTVEDKKLLHSDLGPNCGCAGNIVFANHDLYWPIFKKYIFDKLEELLRSNSFFGPLDVNAIWLHDGPRFLEFTPRFGYDAIQTYIQLFLSPVSEALYNAATGKNQRIYVEQHAFTAGVRVSIPPYPHSDKGAPKGLLIKGLDPSDPTLHPSDAMLDEKGRLVTAGADGNIYTATAVDGTWQGAISKCYDKISRINLGDAQYRKDIGLRTDGVLSFLHQLSSDPSNLVDQGTLQSAGPSTVQNQE
jgi:phosphoribosylamine-glycine ligase